MMINVSDAINYILKPGNCWQEFTRICFSRSISTSEIFPTFIEQSCSFMQNFDSISQGK